MHDVFKECPEEHTDKKNSDYLFDCQPDMTGAEIQHVRNDRDIHAPDHQRMCLGKVFEVAVVE